MVKNHENRPFSFATGATTTKHPKLELLQRVEHVSTPREGPKMRFSPYFDHFKAKFGLKRGENRGWWVCLMGQNRSKMTEKSIFAKPPRIAPRWLKVDFWASRGPKKPHRASYTLYQMLEIWVLKGRDGRKFGQNAPFWP